MSDVVSRLHNRCIVCRTCPQCMAMQIEAAAEIERLRAELDLVARSLGEFRLLVEVGPALKDEVMEIIKHIDRTLRSARAARGGE